MKLPKFLELTPEEEKKIKIFENANELSESLFKETLQYLVDNQLIDQGTFDDFSLPLSSITNIGKQRAAEEKIEKAIKNMATGSELSTTTKELDVAFGEPLNTSMTK